MLRMTPQSQVYLALGPTDLRNNIDGLALMVQLSLSDLPLFNEAEAFREPLNIEPDLEKVISKQSQKKSKHRGNKKDLKNIPVETTVYTLSGKELLCPNCGNELKEMKEEVQTVLEVIPAQVKVHKHVIKHYSCRACAKNKKSSIVKASGAPLKIIPKSIASPSLMADIISKKYVDATPFYRQEQNFKRRSIPVTRNNMCNWSIDVSKMYFAPLVSRMKEIMFAEGVIHCDETYTEVLFEPDRPTSRT